MMSLLQSLVLVEKFKEFSLNMVIGEGGIDEGDEMLSFLFGVKRTQKVETAFYFLKEVLEIGGKNVTLSF
jgi:hypothetical protein